MSKVIDVSDASTEQGRPFLKSGSYSIRVTVVEKKQSKAKNDMLVYQYEICAPDSVTNDEGKAVKITGLSLTDFVVFTPEAEGSRKKLKALCEFHGLPTKIDIENPVELKKMFVGKAYRVQLATEGGVATDENTGQPILDNNGQPITTNQYRIRRVLGADTENTIPAENMAY